MSNENKDDKAQKTRQAKLIGALETIKEGLANEELEALRSSIVKVDSNLTRRLEDMHGATTQTVDRLSRELSQRIDLLAPKLAELERKQAKALAEFDERTGRTTAELGRQLQDLQVKSEDRVRTLKKGLEQVINEKDQALNAELSKLGQALTRMQTELKQQLETTQRVAGLLNNMATVFTTGPHAGSPIAGPAGGHAVAAPPATVPDPAANVIFPEGDENLENALDRAFRENVARLGQDPAPTGK